MTATVYTSDGSSVVDHVTVDDLNGNTGDCPAVAQGTPPLVDHDGSGGGTPVDEPPWSPPSSPTGTWPLSSILRCLEQTRLTQAQVLGGVTVYDAAGNIRSRVDAGDVFPPTSYQDAAQTPRILVKGTALEYHRPWKGPGDPNGEDKVQSDSDTPIAISVWTNRLLEVEVTADLGKVADGSVTLRATVSGGDPGSRLTWRWDSGDGQSSAAAGSTTFKYQSGTYTARLQVTGDRGDGGDGQVSFQVPGAQPHQPTTTATQTSDGPTEGGAGPAPPGKASPHDRSPGKTTGSGRHPTTSSGSKGGKQTPAAQPSPQATATPSPTPTPASGGPESGSGGSSTAGGGSQPSAPGGAGDTEPATPDRTQPEKVPDAGLELVTGLLVSNVIPLSAAASPLVTETVAPLGSATAERRPAGGSSVPAVIGGALAVLALLALGAARELDVRWPTLLPGPGS